MSTINGFGSANILADVGQLLQDLSGLQNNGTGAAFNPPSAEHCHRHHPHSGGGDQTAPKNGYNASGTINGDPHYNVNGKTFDFQGQAGSTYCELSDPSTGFTDNTTFKAYGNGANVVGAEGFTFDGNELEVQAGANGQQVYLNGAQLSNGTYLNGEVQVNNGSVELKADNFDFTVTEQGSGSGAYLNTSFNATNAGNQQDGLGGILGSVISNPNASVDSATLSQNQVNGLFANSGWGGTSSYGAGSNQVAGLLQDLGSLLEDVAQIEGNLNARIG